MQEHPATHPNGRFRHQEYGKHYNDSDFWKKLQSLLSLAIGRVLERALLLLELLLDEATPLAAKKMILGALGYLILIVDLIPDFLPGIGFVDDLAAMGLVLSKLDTMVTDDIRQRAQNRMPANMRPESTESGY